MSKFQLSLIQLLFLIKYSVVKKKNVFFTCKKVSINK